MNIPYMPSGTVYGTLLNFQREQALWAPRMSVAPYKAPPKAPVLYIKTANTFTPPSHAIALPPEVDEVDVSASLGLMAGEIVLAGSFTRPVAGQAGDLFEADYGPLGCLKFRFV